MCLLTTVTVTLSDADYVIKALLFNGVGKNSPFSDCAHVTVGGIMCVEDFRSGYSSWTKSRTKIRLRLQQKQVDFWLRFVTVPGVQEEARRNGVEMEKNKDRSSCCDSYVTRVDVR